MSPYQCSECKREYQSYRELEQDSEYLGPGMVARFDVCPNCGARNPPRVPSV